ncbi:MAG: MoaD/ThiS family protein [Maritimibacter sp.]|nr:MoaD/ThiS family protein [Maritimibacter sp.]
MVEVNLWSGLGRVTGGETVVEVEGETVGALLDALVAVHPGLAPFIEAGVSVAVDGEIITGDRLAEVPAGAEVFLMQRVKGG